MSITDLKDEENLVEMVFKTENREGWGKNCILMFY